MQAWGIVFATLAYLLFLFVVASYGDHRRSLRPDSSSRSRPAIYALSLAVYCTSWTFFGSVGFAATSGLDFLAIYLGPMLMITIGFPLFSHVVAVAKAERITSIADFIASRYGKSAAVGALTTIIAVLGTVPYIALQLKAISVSIETMVLQVQTSLTVEQMAPVNTSLIVSIFLAVFAILFGTRHADATEHQDGLVLAVATESIVKLVAFLAVGIFVTFYLFDGFGDLLAKASDSTFVESTFLSGFTASKFLIFTLLSLCAFMLLPRQFHMGVVENNSQQDLKTARWMFPLYLVLINLFVVPVALAGLLTFGSSVDADIYVLALPLNAEAGWISMLVFLGGISAATAMVVVACVALAIMISNNLILPLSLRRQRDTSSGRVRNERPMEGALLNIRRTAIFVMLAMAYFYVEIARDSTALASIGLLSFAAIAQFAPSFFLGLFWRRPTELSAIAGMTVGFMVWTYTLFLPTVLPADHSIMAEGLFGLSALHPQKLFGIAADPLTHGVLFSLLANTVIFIACSYIRQPLAIERMQASVFWILGRRTDSVYFEHGRAATIAELKHEVANYLGLERTNRSFDAFFEEHGEHYNPRDLASAELIRRAEQILASAIGAASSRLVISLLLKKHDPAEDATIQLLGDASQAIQYNRDLLQTALDHVEQGLCVFDEHFRLSSWNQQFRSLLDLPDTLGQVGTPLSTISDAIAERLDPESIEKSELARQLLKAVGPFEVKLVESYRVLEIQTNNMPGGGVVISFNETTEKVLAAETLQTANETLERRVRERTEELTRLNEDLAKAREFAEAANIGKTKFLAAVGHDILQPLNAARLYTSSLVEKLDKSATSNLAKNVDDALESVEDILGAVLAISRLDSGVLTPNVSEFSIDRLFKKLLVEFNPIAATKGLKLNVISNDLSIRSDYNLLRRLLQNLISNAIKYSNSGTVTLDAKVKANEVICEVRDTGSGINKEDFEAIFKEFHRLEEGKQAAPGLGLGLSIVKRLATTLEHTISFDTQKEKGTSFYVSVPLAVQKKSQISKTTPNTDANMPLSHITVLCIDNDPRILDGMRNLLSGWGCKVHSFENQEALLSDLETIQPDILLADYHLDKGTGLEAISQARKHLGSDFPAVLITADRSAAVRQQTKAADVELMHKPLKPAALRALFTRQFPSASSNTPVAAE